ncbi:hypothetical protein [Streptomyces zaomyceticus]|uniref:hypothetical protein n=1 Tax=Streptomyces zaomyceticus TaxID=68286 RepID=UPI003426E5D9
MSNQEANGPDHSADDAYGQLLQLLENLASVRDVLKLPQPSVLRYDRHTHEQCADLVERIKDTWLAVLERREGWQRVDPDKTDEENDAFWRASSLILAAHFSTALKYAEVSFLGGKSKGWSPFLKSFRRGLLLSEYGVDAAVERRLLSDFCAGWWDSSFMEVVGSAAMGKTPVGYDLFVFWAIEHLSEVALFSPHQEHLRMGHLLSRALAERSREAVDRRDKADIEFRDRIWRDAVSVRELPALASRQKGVVEKYGEKHVESKFEDSLNLLMQGLGFMVIPTRQGQRRVDMICISPGGDSDPYAILIEAKSSHNNYALPTKDSRAISEYVDSVRGRLRTLPPLRLVLIVGPEGAKTLGGKVRDLDFELPVPVRYMPIRTLLLLRESLPGVVPAQAFLRAMMAAESVVLPVHVESVISAFRTVNAAHSEFISRMLDE